MSSTLQAVVGARIRQSRCYDLELTQTEFAFKVGSATRTVQSWEDGSRIPRSHTMQKISEVTGRPVSWFYEQDGAVPQGWTNSDGDGTA